MLIMVISLLALLFVIVTGFINFARVDRELQVQVRSSDRNDQVAAEIADRVTSLVAAQIQSSSGGMLAGGDPKNYSAEDIPGYRHSFWLASTEPVWNEGLTLAERRFGSRSNMDWDVLDQLAWPAVTSLMGGPGSSPALHPIATLIPEFDGDENPTAELLLDTNDVVRFARKPMLDADGDGIPDSSFMGVASATELANTLAGAPVRLGGSGLNINKIPNPDATTAAQREQVSVWQRFREDARYDVGVRVVSHGGMVTLDSAPIQTDFGSQPPLNRAFTVGLFNSIRHPDETVRTLGDYDPSRGVDGLFADLAENRSQAEAALRRRGGMLPGAENQQYIGSSLYWARNVPPVLGWLQGEPRPDLQYALFGFNRTFIPPFDLVDQRLKLETWERFNLGDARLGRMGGPFSSQTERAAWAWAAALRPDEFNRGGNQQINALRAYSRRQILTTTNNSDDLARKQSDKEPTRSLTNSAAGDAELTTHAGELKFYLGEIAKAFQKPAQGVYTYDPLRGRVIVERLARIYGDMISGTEDWGGAYNYTWKKDEQAVSKREQAFMLAVNTVAFAAPRFGSTSAMPGFVDVVSYTDGADPTLLPPHVGKTYVGYAPQPYLSEVIAYRESEDVDDPNDPNNTITLDKYAIAVELFNPQDPYEVGSSPDPFALWLPQFAISINNVTGASADPLFVLSENTAESPFIDLSNPNRSLPQRLAGRSFTSVAIRSATKPNNRFDSQAQRVDGLFVLPDPYTIGDANDEFIVRLWRRRYDMTQPNPWYVIDEMRVEAPKRGLPDADPGRDDQRWASSYRDPSPAVLFNKLPPDAFGRDRYARWNLATNKSKDAGANGRPSVQTLKSSQVLTGIGGGSDPDPPYGGGPASFRGFAPTTPLITMNAGPSGAGPTLYEQMNDLPMFSDARDLRPRSFPTVGFLLFVPRFANVSLYNGTTGLLERTVPTSELLRRQWNNLEAETQAEADADSEDANAPPWALSADYPADFGHMPVFDNGQKYDGDSYFGDAGEVPWGLLVFDYFTTVDPDKVDPLRIPGRININTAPWYVLSKIPMLGPNQPTDGDFSTHLLSALLRRDNGAFITSPDGWPSPSFWDPTVGVLVGANVDGSIVRTMIEDYATSSELSAPAWLPYVATPEDVTKGLYRLGPWLAQSAVAYRDGVQVLSVDAAQPWSVFTDSQLRNETNGEVVTNPGSGTVGPTGVGYRNVVYYGEMRGTSPSSDNGDNRADRPTKFGFLTVGELANVKGFDSSAFLDLPPWAGATPETTALGLGDFVKGVSLLALIDSQWLTTRSNTFTVYTSVMDREDPQNSLRSQVTLDRSNLLPRLTYVNYSPSNPNRPQPTDPLIPLVAPTSVAGVYEAIRAANAGGSPEIIAQRRAGFFNARMDE
ncbi:MAG: hypothetical protein HRF50_07000 [Phycisphaerae bacterium]